MYSKMPTKRKISIFFGFGWPSIVLFSRKHKEDGLFDELWKKYVSTPSYNSLNYLHFALVSMETENLG